MWPGAMGEIRLHSYWAAAALWFAFWWEHHLLAPSSNQKVTALFNRALTAITESFLSVQVHWDSSRVPLPHPKPNSLLFPAENFLALPI